MYQHLKRPKGQVYDPPRAEIIQVEPQFVLCGSGINGNSNENVIIGGFDWV